MTTTVRNYREYLNKLLHKTPSQVTTTSITTTTSSTTIITTTSSPTKQLSQDSTKLSPDSTKCVTEITSSLLSPSSDQCTTFKSGHMKRKSRPSDGGLVVPTEMKLRSTKKKRNKHNN